MLTAADVMTADVISVAPETPVRTLPRFFIRIGSAACRCSTKPQA